MAGAKRQRETEGPSLRIHYTHPFAAEVLSVGLTQQLNRCCARGRGQPVIVCIGTDRSTGDSLGPLVGTQLQLRLPEFPIYGTLEEPVHAANLKEFMGQLAIKHPTNPILAIDACLGAASNIGMLSIKPGPLRPGTGVNKDLPPIGHCHLIGIVNVAGFMEYMVLQNTRLSLVYKMAQTICQGVALSFQNQSWIQDAQTV
ncbi:MAG: spore protease YyaC [Limnochordia bacterium]|jgi:putative sporulation protein YyaC